MIVKQIYTNNNYRNFNYLIACPITREAAAIDPLASELCLKEAENSDFKITSIINTHEHYDHIAGNSVIIKQTGAKLYAPNNAKNTIKNIDVGLDAGDIIKIGKNLNIEILDTPGHTLSHICLLVRGENDSIFCGDTIFNAGVGNCHNGGDPLKLYETIYGQIIELDPKTKIFPGHEYLKNNLLFTLHLEPNNIDAKKLLEKAKDEEFSTKYVSTIEKEYLVNAFFRLEKSSIISKLKTLGELKGDTSPKEIFLALRKIRNTW